MKSCFCGRMFSFSECCEPYISGVRLPARAELLMRSRYSAYVTGAIPYIVQTTHPYSCLQVNSGDIALWLLEVTSWDRLEVLDVVGGGDHDEHGVVEFIAHFHHLGKATFLHERSQFRRVDGVWLYLHA